MLYSRFSERSTVTSCSTQEYIWVNLTVKRILGHSTIACFKICDTLVRYGDIASRRGGGMVEQMVQMEQMVHHHHISYC